MGFIYGKLFELGTAPIAGMDAVRFQVRIIRVRVRKSMTTYEFPASR
jgi:hypothetical protein